MEEKKMRIVELLAYTFDIPEMRYFDVESNNLLDEKIEVLEQIKSGKMLSEIPNFYDILENLPKDKESMWD